MAIIDAIVIASIGIVFFVARALTRRYGFLVPGMILGFGSVGVWLQDVLAGVIVLGAAWRRSPGSRV